MAAINESLKPVSTIEARADKSKENLLSLINPADKKTLSIGGVGRWIADKWLIVQLPIIAAVCLGVVQLPNGLFTISNSDWKARTGSNLPVAAAQDTRTWVDLIDRPQILRDAYHYCKQTKVVDVCQNRINSRLAVLADR